MISKVPQMNKLRRALIFFSISFSIIAFDQLSKSYVVYSIPLNQGRPIIENYLDLVHVRNSGAAFGFFSGSKGSPNRWILTTVSVSALIAILGMTFWLPETSLLVLVAYALFFGGAAGNLLDRLLHGEVIDFIDVHVGGLHWPAFNVADSSLCLGAALFCFYVIKHKK